MRLEIRAVEGIGEIGRADDLGALVAAAADPPLVDADVVVVTQKVVSKSEGRIVALDHDDPAARAALVESESRRIVRRRGELIISETHHGFVCANAGVDLSNVAPGTAALLPVDPDRSARRIRDQIRAASGVEVGVIVSDTFGRPWRNGVTDVAIGVAGVAAVVDLRGTVDGGGRKLAVTEVAVADELAAAADLVLGKASGCPAAVISGVRPDWLRQSSVASEMIRRPADDLFR